MSFSSESRKHDNTIEKRQRKRTNSPQGLHFPSIPRIPKKPAEKSRDCLK
jgi:hypothetical protein